MNYALGGPSFDLPVSRRRAIPWNREHIPGGLVLRLGGSGRRRVGAHGEWGRTNRRLDPWPRRVLRYGRVEADLRPGLPARACFRCRPRSTIVARCPWTVGIARSRCRRIAGYGRASIRPASIFPYRTIWMGSIGVWTGCGSACPGIFSPRRKMCRPRWLRRSTAPRKRLAKLGAVSREITLPDYDLFNACGRIIMYNRGVRDS